MTVPASSYNPIIPMALDDPSVSQSQLLLNFGALQTWLDVNHVDYASVNAGKHFFVEFPVQSPVPTTAAGEVGLYCQTSTYTGNPELVFSHQSAGGIAEFTSSGQITNGGWSYLPSAILLKWGTGSPSGSGSYVITFPTGAAYPVFGTAFTAFITPTSNMVVYITALTTTQLTVTTSGSGTFNYLVIGI